MSIPGPLYQELHNALLSAFSRNELTILVRTHLDERFEALTADKNLAAQVDELLCWAERMGRLRELAESAVHERPRSAELQAVWAKLAVLPASAFAPRLPGNGWRVPFRQNKQFVGRDEDLTDLHAALQQGTAVCIRPAGLTGLGGIGKTQLAVEYCYRYRDAYPGGVFWLNAAGEWLFAFAGLGRFLDEDVDGKALDRQARTVSEYFAAHPDSLLVLDNVQDPALLRMPVTPELTPAVLPCRVLFTTRRRDLGDDFTPVELTVLPEEPGLRLLLRHPVRQPALELTHPDHAVAAEIYRILGGLPLGLEIAGTHLGKMANRPIAVYCDELLARGALAVVDDPRGKVKETDLGTRHAAAVEATLAEQWDTLQSDDACLLLRVAGQFPEAEVIPAPRLGLLAGISDRNESFFGAPLVLALDELYDAALIERLAGDAIRLHPLVRDFAARRTPSDDVTAFRSACAANLLAAYRDFSTLEDHCARRGVQELEADLLAALAFSSDEPSLQSPISNLHRMLQRESHILRGWDTVGQPQAFAQQWLKRAVIDGDGAMQAQVRSTTKRSIGLTTRWLTVRTSPMEERTLTGHDSAVLAVAVTPDGRRVISASGDGTLKVWDLATGAEERTLTGHGSGVLAVAVTPDGRRVISASSDIKVWDLATGAEERTLSIQDKWVHAVAVTPDGWRAISASDDRTLKVWNLATGTLEWTLTGHGDSVDAVVVTPDGQRAISASLDRTLKVWDLATGAEERTLARRGLGVSAVAVTSDGRRVISASVDGTLMVRDMVTGVLEQTLAGHGELVNAVAVTPDGQRVISASRDGTLKVWNLAMGAEERTPTGHVSRVIAVAVTPDGRRVISASRDIKVWDLATGAEERTLSVQDKWVHAVAMTPDGRRVISASSDRTLKVWDVITGAEVQTLTAHGLGVSMVVVTPDGQRAISASLDRTLKVWDLATGAEERTLTGHSSGITAVAVTPDGRRVISASRDIKVWDLATGAEERTLTGHGSRVQAVAVTPDGRRVISASWDRTLKVWDVATGAEERTLTGHGSGVLAVAVTPDGRRVISASDDRTLKVWDLATGAEERTLTGHGGRGLAVAVTPDGRRVISASWDRTLKVWDVATGQEITIIVLEAGLECVAVAPDGVTIVAGDAVGSVYCLRYQEAAAKLENLD